MANGTLDAAAGLPARPAGRFAALTITERNFLKSMVWVVAIVAVFWCGYKLERDVFDRHPGEKRFIREASESATRYVTIPHFLIGFLFMASAPKNRTPRKRAWIGGLMLASTALCAFYAMGGGRTNLLLYAGVALYFLVHELRDETMFYSALGDSPPVKDPAAMTGMLRALTGLIVLTIALFIWVPAPFGVYIEKLKLDGTSPMHETLASLSIFNGSLPIPLRLAVGMAPLVIPAAAFHYTLKHYARRLGFAGVGQMVETYKPLFRVIIGVVLVLGLAMLITQRIYPLVMFHVVAWYIFASHQLARFRPKTPPRGWWAWMRTTPEGFKTLHIGLFVFMMVLGLLWTFAFDHTVYLHWVLSPAAFFYWTIIHITVSFVPR